MPLGASDKIGENDHPVMDPIHEKHTVESEGTDQTVGKDHPVEEEHTVECMSSGAGDVQADDHPVDRNSDIDSEHPIDVDKEQIRGDVQNKHPVEEEHTVGCMSPVDGNADDHPVVRSSDFVSEHPVDGDKEHIRGDVRDVSDAGQAGGVSHDGPEQLRVANAVPMLPSDNKGFKNRIDKYLVKVDMGAAMKLARKDKEVKEGSQIGKDASSKPATSTVGRGTKKQTIFKKKQTRNFTPSKEKIFNFFEKQGEKDDEEDGVALGNLKTMKSKAKQTTKIKSQLHIGSSTTTLQRELKARPGRQHGQN